MPPTLTDQIAELRRLHEDARDGYLREGETVVSALRRMDEARIRILNALPGLLAAAEREAKLRDALRELVVEGENVNCGKKPGIDLRSKLSAARAALAATEGK